MSNASWRTWVLPAVLGAALAAVLVLRSPSSREGGEIPAPSASAVASAPIGSCLLDAGLLRERSLTLRGPLAVAPGGRVLLGVEDGVHDLARAETMRAPGGVESLAYVASSLLVVSGPTLSVLTRSEGVIQVRALAPLPGRGLRVVATKQGRALVFGGLSGAEEPGRPLGVVLEFGGGEPPRPLIRTPRRIDALAPAADGFFLACGDWIGRVRSRPGLEGQRTVDAPVGDLELVAVTASEAPVVSLAYDPREGILYFVQERRLHAVVDEEVRDLGDGCDQVLLSEGDLYIFDSKEPRLTRLPSPPWRIRVGE